MLSLEERETAKKPSWLKVKFPSEPNFFIVSNILNRKKLHTICQSAKCPNITECWSKKTATFLILGNICTRSCAFCAVEKGTPLAPSVHEPANVAKAASLLGLQYVVVTSVTRDDLPDGGASFFVETIMLLRKMIAGVKVEVLVPDFNGNREALVEVVQARPEVINHNLETTESNYPRINRAASNYKRSLEVLETARKLGAVTKSGLMVGLGETKVDIIRSFSHLRIVGCGLLTLGQYLQPTRNHVPVMKYYSPTDFEELKEIALDFGFKDVESGPLVRSSYNAHRMYESLQEKTA